MLNMHEI